MRKILALLLCAMMLLVGCGKQKIKPSPTAPAPVPPEIFDAGNVKVTVPDGWKAFPKEDIFSEDGAVNPDALVLIPGGISAADQLTKPYVEVYFFGEDRERMEIPLEFYSDPVTVTPFTTGSHTWEGFSTTDLGGLCILWSDEEVYQYQVNILLQGADGQSIRLEDPQVQQILTGIAPSLQGE